MRFSRLFSGELIFRLLLFVVVAGLVIFLAACGESDGKTPSGTAAKASVAAAKGVEAKNGAVLRGDGLMIDGTASATILRGYSSQPLSLRLMAGWVDRDKIALANKASNEDERCKQAMGSFGLMTVHVAAGTAEAGTYQLAPKAGGPQTGTVIIDEDEDAGLSSTLTSQSGTLTIKSVTMNDSGSWVLAVEGVFEGQFSGRDGSRREFSGDFRFVPEAK